ncbi:DUF4399 domain-containing protein [Candidatus Rhodoblastus alkanivorans]|uniref:DUF4399 domain-containing protein n=1 Tax=Candidatus Rhodoblastus alkanivorans TaxID=2954117 RepID=A0ABS9Z7H0_9HYPH|nr:DUF4399 domain-containing protein [Candidatus Rhodoblastus alkanivorans]MCI4683547.1 DUF4399 domain-containing protein [Candidatus Rhodoblastus alkanivorans]
MSGTRAFSLFIAAALLALSWLNVQAAAAEQFPRKPAPEGARIYFSDLKDGAAVSSRFTVHFAAENIAVVPTDKPEPNSGHFHIIIDNPLPPPDVPIPNDPNHLHFGRGQQEAEIILPAGDHTLQLLMGDEHHMQFIPPVASEAIHVHVGASTVEKPRVPAPPGARISFVGLEDGAKIPTHSTVKFGASGVVIAAAGKASQEIPGSGHFHLLIDTDLPPLDREIPSDPNHIHFGRGQMETQLDLTPGPHTLQLLLGDYEHIPHDPPIMSKLIHVVAVDNGAPKTASAAPPPGRTPSPPDARVYFIYPKNGDTIYPHSTIRFGLSNMGVCPAGVYKLNTGHHHLLIDLPTPPLDKPLPNEPNLMHFGRGETEVKLSLSPGKHTLQLIFADYRHTPHDPPVISQRIEVTVLKPGQRLHPVQYHHHHYHHRHLRH